MLLRSPLFRPGFRWAATERPFLFWRSSDCRGAFWERFGRAATKRRAEGRAGSSVFGEPSFRLQARGEEGGRGVSGRSFGCRGACGSGFRRAAMTG